MKLERWQVAWRAAQDLQDGMYVNLGVGISTLVDPSFIPYGREVIFHSENGVLGIAPLRGSDSGEVEFVNASQRPATLVTGGCYFDCCMSFMMLRGRHVDLAMLGAFQVSMRGDIASWSLGKDSVPPAVGGAMDIAVGAKEIWVLMEHVTSRGEPRILQQCTLDLTSEHVVSRIFTDLAVLEVTAEGLIVVEAVPGMTLSDLQSVTDAPLQLAPNFRTLTAPRENTCL